MTRVSAAWAGAARASTTGMARTTRRRRIAGRVLPRLGDDAQMALLRRLLVVGRRAVAPEELVHVGPRGALGRAAGEHAEVAAGPGLQPHLGGVGSRSPTACTAGRGAIVSLVPA